MWERHRNIKTSVGLVIVYNVEHMPRWGLFISNLIKSNKDE